MRYVTHTNGFEYSVPASLSEAETFCGTTKDKFFPWANRSFDSTSKIGEALKCGPVTTFATKSGTYLELWFTVEGNSYNYKVSRDDINRFYKISLHIEDRYTNTNKQIPDVIKIDSLRSADRVVFEDKHKEMFLVPGGFTTISKSQGIYTQYLPAFHRGSSNNSTQQAVDMFNEHVAILKSLWRTETLLLKKADVLEKAQVQGITEKDLKDKLKYEQKVLGHADRTKKTMKVLPELIKARNVIDDFISMLNADGVYTSQDVTDFQSAMERVKDSVSEIRHVGKFTL